MTHRQTDPAYRHLWALALLLGHGEWELEDGTPIDAQAHLLALVDLTPNRERERLVERCWSMAGALSLVLDALGRPASLEDVLTRVASAVCGSSCVNSRSMLYMFSLGNLRRLAEAVEHEHDVRLDELAQRKVDPA